MDKYLITGFSGFVSQHFLSFLEKREIHTSVLGIDICDPGFDYHCFRCIECDFKRMDLLDDKRIQEAVYRFQPNYILHLASYSSVMFSWKNPALSFQNNTNIFLNLLEIVRLLNADVRILSIGSSEEYGDVSDKDLPLREDQPLRPVSPYAVARVSQEMLTRVYVKGYGLDIVMTRSFNHVGPGQNEIFVVSSFARHMVEALRNGITKIELKTGDLSIVRDFTDVRDVVRAYHLLLSRGKKGEVYNICSGHGVALSDILSMLSEKSDVETVRSIDPKLVRPSDNRRIVGSNEKIAAEVGWKPEISLDTSLNDVLGDWRTRLENS